MPNLFNRGSRSGRRSDQPQPEPTAVERYLAGGGNPTNDRAVALMMEVDRGNARRAEQQQRDTNRDAALNLPPAPEPTGDPIADAIAQAEHKATVARIRHDAMRAQHRQESAVADEARAAFLTYCRPAAPAEYATWLTGHLGRSGRITHAYDRDMPRMWVLERAPQVRVPSLYGAQSVQVIVPAEVRFTPGDLPKTFHGACGHSEFYFLADFTVVGSVVPLYDDVKALLTA